jgi:magnesium transporter
MSEAAEQDQSQERLKAYKLALGEDITAAREVLNAYHPAEIALLLESLPAQEREAAWELVDPEHDGDVLLYVNEDIRASFISDMETNELVAATENLETDDLADLIQDLPEDVIQQLLISMDEQDRHRLEAVLSYSEDTAGGLMNTDTVTVRPDVTLDVVLRYLRLRGEVPDMTDSLVVVDRDDRFLGVLQITDLLIKMPQLKVAQVMTEDVVALPATMPAAEVATMFEHRDLISAPVIDGNDRLVGRITIDDVVDVIRDQAEHSFMGMAGLTEEEDTFAPVFLSARRRGVWLGVNLITVLIASWVIGLFEHTIEQVVALAVLMPIVASMGGIAGSQALTIVIRGMALGQIGVANARRIVSKELAVGLLNGVLWSLVIAMIAILWFDNVQMGMIIAWAIVINLVAGAVAGATIPLLMRRLGADPALGGTVLLTTVTDVVGFLSFLGLATLFLV